VFVFGSSQEHYTIVGLGPRVGASRSIETR
jgi:hypothetical protein